MLNLQTQLLFTISFFLSPRQWHKHLQFPRDSSSTNSNQLLLPDTNPPPLKQQHSANQPFSHDTYLTTSSMNSSNTWWYYTPTTCPLISLMIHCSHNSYLLPYPLIQKHPTSSVFYIHTCPKPNCFQMLNLKTQILFTSSKLLPHTHTMTKASAVSPEISHPQTVTNSASRHTHPHLSAAAFSKPAPFSWHLPHHHPWIVQIHGDITLQLRIYPST